MNDKIKTVYETLELAKEFVTKYMVYPLSPEWEMKYRTPLLEKLELSFVILDSLNKETNIVPDAVEAMENMMPPELVEKIIKELVELMTNLYKKESVSESFDQEHEDFIKSYYSDTVEPSEDVDAFIEKLDEMLESESDDANPSHRLVYLNPEKAAAIITARDKRIKAEEWKACADRYCDICDPHNNCCRPIRCVKRASIMRTEVEG